MATYTSNLSLKKPAQSDKIRIADLNGNADNIDAAIGADFGQSSKPSINAAINSLADGLAIVAQGDVHAAIRAGQFVYVRNHSTLAEGLYVASAAISANAALSGTNLTADASGGLNALNSKIEYWTTNNTNLNSLTWNQGGQGKYEAKLVDASDIGKTVIGATIRQFASLKEDDYIQVSIYSDNIFLMSNKNSFATNASISVRYITMRT